MPSTVNSARHSRISKMNRALAATRPEHIFSTTPVRQAWLAGVLILLSLPNAFAESDFSAFWKTFKSAVMAGDKTKVAEMTIFPLSMSYGVKAVKSKEAFLRRYSEIFKGEANATQCFGSAEPHKESDRRYEIYCPFKETPDDRENTPIRFIFERTKSGWRFVGLDNINE